MSAEARSKLLDELGVLAQRFTALGVQCGPSSVAAGIAVEAREAFAMMCANERILARGEGENYVAARETLRESLVAMVSFVAAQLEAVEALETTDPGTKPPHLKLVP